MPTSITVDARVSPTLTAYIEVTITGGTPARRRGHPDTWEPEEPPCVEVEAVQLCDDGSPDADVWLTGADAVKWVREQGEGWWAEVCAESVRCAREGCW